MPNIRKCSEMDRLEQSPSKAEAPSFWTFKTGQHACLRHMLENILQGPCTGKGGRKVAQLRPSTETQEIWVQAWLCCRFPVTPRQVTSLSGSQVPICKMGIIIYHPLTFLSIQFFGGLGFLTTSMYCALHSGALIYRPHPRCTALVVILGQSR